MSMILPLHQWTPQSNCWVKRGRLLRLHRAQISSPSKVRLGSAMAIDDSSNRAMRPRKISGIVFDMDGTLCKPQNYMFSEMRSALNITKAVDILDHVYSLSDVEQQEANEKIEAIEQRAMTKQVPQPGLIELMEWMDRKGLRKAICTRNFDAPVAHLTTTHIPANISPFNPIITREFRPPKPSPEGIFHIARSWGIDVSSSHDSTSSDGRRWLPLLMVGDSIDDMIAGHEAGAITILLESEGKEDLKEDSRTDVVVQRLDQIIELFEGSRFEVDSGEALGN